MWLLGSLLGAHSEAELAQLHWARGKGPSWPLTLFAGGPDAVTEALRHIEAVSTFLRGDSSQVSLVITPFTDVNLESYKNNAGCCVEIREQRVGGSLVDLAPPCDGEHLCVSVHMSPGSHQDFVISVKGATWPIRHELVALGCPREEQQDGSWQHRTPVLNMTDRRVLNLVEFLKGTFFVVMFMESVPAAIRALFESRA